MSWTKGPTKKELKPGVCRYRITYRVHDGDKWTAYQMWKTDKVGRKDAIGADLYQRLSMRPNMFEILSVLPVEGELELGNVGAPSMVITPQEYEEMRQKEMASVSRKDLADRAREHGWDDIAKDITKGDLELN